MRGKIIQALRATWALLPRDSAPAVNGASKTRVTSARHEGMSCIMKAGTDLDVPRGQHRRVCIASAPVSMRDTAAARQAPSSPMPANVYWKGVGWIAL